MDILVLVQSVTVIFVTTLKIVCSIADVHFSAMIETTGVVNGSSVVVVEQNWDISTSKCIQNCKRRMNCDFLNYHTVAHLCQLIHVNDGVQPTVSQATGFLYGSKSEWNMNNYHGCNVCSENEACIPTQGNLCEITGCGPPPDIPSSVVLGNVNTVNSRVVHNQPVSGIQMTHICASNGTWSMESMTVPPTTTTITTTKPTTTTTTATTTTTTTTPTTTTSGGYVTSGWIEHPSQTGKFYMVVSTPVDWHTARDYCDQWGYLAVVYHSTEETVVSGLVEDAGLTSYWAGATDEATEGTWKWVLSTLAWGYDNFGDSGPPYGSSTDCLLITTTNSVTWSDEVCSKAHAFVCED